MKKNAMRKNLRQSILKSFGRYIAIVAIIALGASMFVGLLMTKTDMVATGQKYMDEKNMFDLRLASSYGWDQDQLQVVRSLPEIEEAEGLIYLDAIARMGEEPTEKVFRFYAMPERLNQLTLTGGRMPTGPEECLIDGYIATDEILGTKITISQGNSEDTLDALVHKSYTIVGYVSTPLYMDMNRGTTSVGSGNLETYLFLSREAFDVDYYTEIHVTLPGEYEVYTDRYNDAMKAAAEELEPMLEGLAEDRFQKVRRDALEQYYDGLYEYHKGVKEFHEGEQEAKEKLAEAWQEILDAEQQLADGKKEIESGWRQLQAGKQQLIDAQRELDEGKAQMDAIKEPLYQALESTASLVETGRGNLLRQIGEKETEIQQIDRQLAGLDDELSPTDTEIFTLGLEIADLSAKISICQSNIQAAQGAIDFAKLFPIQDKNLIASLESEIARHRAQMAEYTARKTELEARRDEIRNSVESTFNERLELQNRRLQLLAERNALQQTLSLADAAWNGILDARAALDARFADAEQQIIDGQNQINAGWAQISGAEKKLKDAEEELEKGLAELEKGKQDYEEGKLEAEAELADAEQKLKDAKAELDDARDTIEDMEEPSLYILDRNSNVGYGSLDSSSDIVQGVSRVFPAFFLLVAALVCITTMTRMIDEERTQIGTLKALGYTNREIISKYLIYAGSGAVIGCGLGVLVGSMIFPFTLWQAYKIMLYITEPIVLCFNWWLCGIVVASYTSVMLFVTWYCCRRALQEQPAELIRPKAPEAGKKIFLEYLPFWRRISFLNKVTIRNIFRYRQRFAMMMVGIGGCTALLLTGFGLRDSIINVVNYQFEEVTVYDMQVYFSGEQTDADQEKFLRKTGLPEDNVLFYNQQSMDLEFDTVTQEIIMMTSDGQIQDFIDFHKGNEKISMPGVNEVLLTAGVADAMGIQVGDTVLMRNADMLTLELMVSGIYDNHVYNYAVILPATQTAQWGIIPEKQMAMVKAGEGQDLHSLSATITGMIGVMNVSVSEDLANMVAGMMDALDLVIWVIVLCAGLLAVIVLYNLTNININERIREIATIKVLGFNAGETGAYVFKENLSLSAIGSVFGLGMGYLLLQFVMSQIKINMVWFKALTSPVSYILAVALTMIAACVVDFVFYFKLDKINMAEALKSVE